MNRIKKNDTVLVTAGRYKGQKAKVLELLADDRVRVEGIDGQMVVKRHLKGGRTAAQPESAIVDRPATVHISNLMPFDAAANTGVRVRIVEEGGKKVRKSVKSDTVFP